MRAPHELVGAFDIAGITCRVECPEEAFWNLLSPRYAEFASEARPQLGLRVQVRAAPPDDVVARWAGPFARIGGTDGVLTIEGAGFEGTFDERSAEGTIAQPLDPSPFEIFLTAIGARWLLKADGFFLHAAAVVRAGGAYVFFGPSGSGKTTVADLVGERVISDEVVAIRRDGDRYRVSGVPWRGQRLTAPLAGLFRLKKARQTSFTPLSPAEAVRQLLPSVFFPRGDSLEISRFLEIGEGVARTVPAYEMSFAPDRSFWDAIPVPAQGESHALAL